MALVRGRVQLHLRPRLRQAHLSRVRPPTSSSSRDRPGRLPRLRSGGGQLMLDLRGITAGYGDSHRAARRQPGGARRTPSSPCSGPTAPARPPCCGSPPGCCAPPPGGSCVDGVDVTGWASAPARPGRGVPRPRGPRDLPAPDGAGQPPPPGPRRPGRRAASSRGREAFPRLGRAPRPAGGDDERRRAADAGAGPGLRRRARTSSCSTRSRWGSPPRSSTRSSSSCDRLAAEGTALLLVEQYVARALATRRLRLHPQPRARSSSPASPTSSTRSRCSPPTWGWKHHDHPTS